MWIEFLTSIASKNYSYKKGEKANLKKVDAERFIKAGIARSLERKAEVAKKKTPAKKKADDK